MYFFLYFLNFKIYFFKNLFLYFTIICYLLFFILLLIKTTKYLINKSFKNNLFVKYNFRILEYYFFVYNMNYYIIMRGN